MSALLRRAMAARIGGPDAKLALICLCAQAGDADCKATVTGQMAEDALKASELTRQVFVASLSVLRQHRLIGINTIADLTGTRRVFSIDIDLSKPAADDPDIQVDDGTPQSRAWARARALFRAAGKSKTETGEQIGRLIKSAGGDFYKLLDAIQSAERARPHDPFTYITGILTKGQATNGQGLSSAFDRRARGEHASAD